MKGGEGGKRKGRDSGKERGRKSGGGGEGFTQPSPEPTPERAKIHVEKHAVHPSVDAPISHVEPSASCRKEEGEGAREFFPYRSFASWKRNYYETNLFRSAPPTLPCLALSSIA